MRTPLRAAASVPRSVSISSPMLKFLLARGVSLGFNRLVTIRGRKTGIPRTTAIAVIENDGRRWVWAPWGEVHWVQNLRAAGRASIRHRGGEEEVTAVELNDRERVTFFRDVLGPVARRMRFGEQFIRMVDGVDVRDPIAAAEGTRVFELRGLR